MSFDRESMQEETRRPPASARKPRETLHARFLARLAGTSGEEAAETEVPAAWQTLLRDDEWVASGVAKTRAVDEILPLCESGFVDELFEYVREIGAWSLFETLDPKDRQRPLYPFLQFVLFMLMRSVRGIRSMLASGDLLLRDERSMALLGFNVVEVHEGGNRRGLSRRTEPVEVRGPFSFETVADNIVKSGPAALERLFNGVIRALAAHKAFPRKIHAVLDTTDNEATPNYDTDDGHPVPSVTREKRPDVRYNRHAKKVPVTVFGWKVWVVWEPDSKIPLALAIGGINEPENLHAFRVLEMARDNVAGYATIESVVLDRGFIDGKLLSRIEAEITPVISIPLKSNMTAARDARALALFALKNRAKSRDSEGCRIRQRTRIVTRGAGKNSREIERKTVIAEIGEIPCDWWGAEGSTSAANRADFVPKRLHATVVLQWDGKKPKKGEELVLVTTDPKPRPFGTFDAYDRRSLIENCCNREAKETWHLEAHPKRSEAGMRVQTTFVFLSMALVSAFRARRAKAEEAARRGRMLGIMRYRRMVEAQNADKLLVRIGDRYGIFRAYEFAMLGGIDVRWRHALGETLDAVRNRYKIAPLPP